MKWTIFVLGLFLVFGCKSQQQKCEKFVRKYPECFKNDTLVFHDTILAKEIQFELKPVLDSAALKMAIDSLLKAKPCPDVKELEAIIKNVPVKVPDYHEETDSTIVDVQYRNGKLQVKVTIKPQYRTYIIPPTQPSFYPKEERTWREKLTERGSWFLYGMALLAILIVIFGRK